MNLRTHYTPNVYTVEDEDTGEVLVFSLCGELKFVRLFSLSHRQPQNSRAFIGKPFFSDYR